MGECPFCNAAIDEEIARHGGTCPKCFGDVPGDEAPTDPGETARRRLEAADRRALGRGAVVRVTLAATGLLALGGVAAFLALRPAKLAAELDLDAAEFFVDGDLVAWEEPAADEAPTGRRARAPGKVRDMTALDRLIEGGTPLDGSLGGDADAAEPSRGKRAAGAADLGPAGADPAPIRRASAEGGLSRLDALGPTVERRESRDVRLTDDTAIVNMIRRNLDVELPRLRQCYQQRLKANETLAGQWELHLTVTTGGRARSVRAVPLGTSDAELETCMVGMVEKWLFNPIKVDVPVRKTVSFRPHG